MRAWAVVSGVAMVTLLVIESGLACSNARGVWFHYHDRPGVERARFLAGELGVLRAVVRRGLSLCRLSLFDRASAIGSVKEAASNLVRAMSTRDKTAVVIFNDEIQQSTYFTAFQEPLLDAIRELYPEGWTALYDAILHSLEKLAGIAGRKALLVFTDGSDSRPAAAGSKASMEEVIEAGKLSEVTIYTVGFVAESRGVNENFLSTRAHGTGGRAFFPVNVEHLERSFAAIEEELHTQYRIGYAPENEAHDGAWRRIEVRIRGREELVVRTRQGYYALPRTWR